MVRSVALVAVVMLTRVAAAGAQIGGNRDWIADCRANPTCVAVLKPGVGPRTDLGARDSLIELGLRTVAALSELEVGAARRPIMCAATGNERLPVHLDSAVVAAVNAAPTEVVAISKCGIRGDGINWYWSVNGQDGPAWVIFANVLSSDSTSASVDVAYGAAALMGAQWRCRFQRTSGHWQARSCDLGMIR